MEIRVRRMMSNKHRLIVSLTTIHDRLRLLDRTIDSILRQESPPDTVLLNISPEPYLLDSGVRPEDLPTHTRQLIDAGRVVLNITENTGPYRKLIPALKMCGGNDCLIATADDDVEYPIDWLGGLQRSFVRFNCVSAYRCRWIRFDQAGLGSYESWSLIDHQSATINSQVNPSKLVFPTGRCGVMYHTAFFPDISLLEHLRMLAPTNDDLVFKCATLISGINCHAVPFVEAGAQSFDFPGVRTDERLWTQNKFRNDEYLDSIVTHFGWTRFVEILSECV